MKLLGSIRDNRKCKFLPTAQSLDLDIKLSCLTIPSLIIILVTGQMYRQGPRWSLERRR
jgi:hypothetical protein